MLMVFYTVYNDDVVLYRLALASTDTFHVQLLLISSSSLILISHLPTADETGGNRIGICGILLTWISWLLVLVTLPFSLCVCFKVTRL